MIDLVASGFLWIFVFGLLHGLGFASILTEFGLPADLYLAALLWFNVGVEFGQVALLIAAYLAITIWFSDPRLSSIDCAARFTADRRTRCLLDGRTCDVLLLQLMAGDFGLFLRSRRRRNR